MTELRTILETDELAIGYSAGNTGRAVVAFTGVGLAVGGLQIPEFRNSLASTSIVNAVYHVVDKQRSWYEYTHEAIVEALKRELPQFDEVVTLGNSMGAFGAILFAGLLPRCRQALAFVPQFSLDPAVVEENETRWKEYRAPIKEWKIRHALIHLSDAVAYYLFFGKGADAWHVARFREWERDNIGLGLIDGSGHDVARYLREKNLLVEVVDAVVNRGASFAEVTGLMRSHGMQV